MKKLIGIILLSMFFLYSPAEAFRTFPPRPEPRVSEGIKYEISSDFGKGKVRAVNLETNEQLWDTLVYEVEFWDDMEADVQLVVITDLELKDGMLIVKNEKGYEYGLDIKTGEVIEYAENTRKIAGVDEDTKYCMRNPGSCVTVESVIDGDIIKLTNGEKVRLIGIDAPESRDNQKTRRDAKRTGQDIEAITKMGQQSTEFVKGLIKEGQEVRLEFDVQQKDKYGRLLAYVYIPVHLVNGVPADENGNPISFSPLQIAQSFSDSNPKTIVPELLNAYVIESGYATPMTMTPNEKYADLFTKLYQEARENKRGLWVNANICSEKPFSHGVCELAWEIVYYDEETKKCVKGWQSGCSAYTPFKTIEECQGQCESSEEELNSRCKEKAEFFGDCAKECSGYQFNNTEDECEFISRGCCAANIPFALLEECQEQCENKQGLQKERVYEELVLIPRADCTKQFCLDNSCCNQCFHSAFSSWGTSIKTHDNIPAESLTGDFPICELNGCGECSYILKGYGYVEGGKFNVERWYKVDEHSRDY